MTELANDKIDTIRRMTADGARRKDIIAVVGVCGRTVNKYANKSWPKPGRAENTKRNRAFLQAWQCAKTREDQLAVVDRFGLKSLHCAQSKAAQVALLAKAKSKPSAARPASEPVDLHAALAPALKSAIEALAAVLVVVNQHRAQ